MAASRTGGGMPVMDALGVRHSPREYYDRALSPQTQSDLLWAAFWINRPTKDRTAPYWRQIMVIDVFAVLADGVWLYEPQSHNLLPRQKGDIGSAHSRDRSRVGSHCEPDLARAFEMEDDDAAGCSREEAPH